MNTPPRSDEPALIKTSLPIVVSGRDGCDSNGESQKDNLQSEEPNAGEAEERFSLRKKHWTRGRWMPLPRTHHRPWKKNLKWRKGPGWLNISRLHLSDM